MPKLSAQDKKKAALLVQAIREQAKYNKLFDMYPEKGTYCKARYPKQIRLFENTALYNQVALLGGNQVGKTWGVGAYCTALHATGLYPKGWKGRKFDEPTNIAVYAVTNKQLRNVAGKALLGNSDEYGTGMIPKNCFDLDSKGEPKIVHSQGAGKFLDKVRVRHHDEDGNFDGWSTIHFFSHEMGYEAMQGQTLHFVWFDEEPPIKIYTEGIVRTVAIAQEDENGKLIKKPGQILLTFTPLKGLSEVALKFLPNGKLPTEFTDTYVEQITWDDVPHITTLAKEEMMKRMSPMELEARMKGVPVAGSGMVYPIPDASFSVQPFPIPQSWPKMYGFDLSKSRSGVVFLAQDPASEIIYLYKTIVAEHSDFMSIANQIRREAGDWMWGTCEGKNSDWNTGKSWWKIYKDEYGLNLRPANQNPGSKQAGIDYCYSILSNGTFKVFADQRDFFMEKNLYHYEEEPDSKGNKVVHNYFNDILDAWRYAVMHPRFRIDPQFDTDDYADDDDSWMRNPITGY